MGLEVREHLTPDVRTPSPCGGGASPFVVGVCTASPGGSGWCRRVVAHHRRVCTNYFYCESKIHSPQPVGLRNVSWDNRTDFTAGSASG